MLEDIANAVLFGGEGPEIRQRHKNGRVRVCSRQLSPRKALVKVSKANKRKVAVRRLEANRCGVVARLQGRRTPPSRDPVQPSVREQVGLMAALSMSHVGLNRRRLATGGGRSGLSSLPVLRAARREMYSIPGKKVIVTRSGAHLASSTAAFREWVSAICDADLFVERPVRDAVAALNDLGEPPAVVVSPSSPPVAQQDVHVTLGLEKGGDPGTVNIVATIINQPHPNSPSNSILVGVCPCQEDKYDALASMLETHLPQVEALLSDGVVVRSAPRPVRLMLGCDYVSQCNVVGHESATTKQPYLCCKRTRWPSMKQAVLDALFGTLQDITGPLHLRETMHVADQMVIDGATPLVGEPGTPEHQCSVVRSPLLAANLRQNVPIPLHATQGKTHRLLRLAIEMVIVGRSSTDVAAVWRQVGAAFALELFKLLYERRHEYGRIPTMGACSSGAIVTRLVTTAQCSATRSWAKFWTCTSLRTSRHEDCGTVFERHSTARAPFQPKRPFNSGRILLQWSFCLKEAFLGSPSLPSYNF